MSFEARYPGTCGYGDRINPGDLVDYDDENELVHAECSAVEGAAYVNNVAACPDCWTVHRGDCL
ncbi:hypothetical protein [Mycolicibacterium palauense]|uniref:hypothetical protein n=1 Tax=Mycolicibacterium palauense TaxID=2034511 RepID=UPI001FE7C66A|nr:hypothetical protein [Mycolicibacterium palauense]